MAHNVMVLQSGGPTQVINGSLVGVIEAAQKMQKVGVVDRILVPKYGVRGARYGNFVDVTCIEQERLDRIAKTPSAAAGSTRDKPDEEYCEDIFNVAKANNVRYLFIIGGNDSGENARIINNFANNQDYELRVWHIPKTIDNDLLVTDHCPGYGSAARTIATVAAGNSLDNMAIPGVKIDVTMGRHAGFLTAASQLFMQEPGRYGPHAIFVPEDGELDMDEFLGLIDRLYTNQGRAHVVVSEGCTNPEIAAVLSGESDQHGNIQLSGSGALADYLIARVKEELGAKVDGKLRARGDTYGYMQRSMPFLYSEIDLAEAIDCGTFAVMQATAAAMDKSVVIEVPSRNPYDSRMATADLSAMAKDTKSMPLEFVKDHVITDAFRYYAMPFVGVVGEKPQFETLL